MATAELSITQSELHRLLAYNKRTGSFSWRQGYGRVKAGDEAGTIRTPAQGGGIVVTVAGRTWAASRLAWYYVHGKLPDGRLKFVDGNPTNLAFSNLVEERAVASATPAAVYQRAWRDKRRAFIQQLQDANK